MPAPTGECQTKKAGPQAGEPSHTPGQHDPDGISVQDVRDTFVHGALRGSRSSEGRDVPIGIRRRNEHVTWRG
jgi:hypothetical protein